mmetsp:Transcript_95282/g.269335  ORF Transcript_95282/g.269335 Transcript_95282/m.269335 type:complete len:396 (+) Transcript_95282:73-1260(+)
MATQDGLCWASPLLVETLIFVDVDGVLNIGIQESGGSLSFDLKNVEKSLKCKKSANTGSEMDRISSMLLAVASRELGHGEDETYMKYISCFRSCLCDMFVSRLAALIHMAGENCLVVLSSSWRCPKYQKRKTALEIALSRHLGVQFVFTATTAMVANQESPNDRIQLIGDFLADFSMRRCAYAAPLQVLVLDDFGVSAIDGWSCGGDAIDSAADLERHLESRALYTNATVKLIHTYDEWKTESGMDIKIGSGLTLRHFRDAASFLGRHSEKAGSATSSQDSSGVCADRTPPKVAPHWAAWQFNGQQAAAFQFPPNPYSHMQYYYQNMHCVQQYSPYAQHWQAFPQFNHSMAGFAPSKAAMCFGVHVDSNVIVQDDRKEKLLELAIARGCMFLCQV